MVAVGILVLRVVAGALIAAHGAQKLFGVWGGPGLQGTFGMMERMNVYPPQFWGWTAALAEFVGGLLLIFGFLWPLGPLALMAQMTMAILKVHAPKGFWNSKGGFEFPLTLLTIGFALGLTGPGLYSLDDLLRFSLPEPEALIVGIIGITLGILFGLSSASLRGLVQNRGQQRVEHPR